MQQARPSKSNNSAEQAGRSLSSAENEALIPSSRLPTDPFWYDCPGSSTAPVVFLKFYAYGGPLPKNDVVEVVEKAIKNFTQFPRTKIIPRSIRRYTSGNVVLLIHSSGRSNWGILEVVVEGIWDFVNTY